MVYLYENTYSVIPEQSTHAVDLDHVQITSEPTHLDLLSFSDCGWNVRYMDSHSTMDCARAYLITCYGDIREADLKGQPFVVERPLSGCLSIVKLGRCHPIPLDLSIQFVYRFINGQITPKTNRTQIARLSNQIRMRASEADLLLSCDVESLLQVMKTKLSRSGSFEEQLELGL